MYPTLMDARTVSLLNTDENGAYCYRYVRKSMLHGYDKNMLKSAIEVQDKVEEAAADKDMAFLLPQLKIEYLTSMLRCYANELQNPGGFIRGFHNVKALYEDEKLRDCILTVNWAEFPPHFRLIVKDLANERGIKSGLLFLMLAVAKRFQH